MKPNMKQFCSIVVMLSTLTASANVVEIVDGMSYVKVQASDGKKYKIKRTQDRKAYLTNTFALTSRPSPPFFIEPFSVSPGVETYGELELLDFISKKKGIFIDARLANWYAKSAIPTAVNIPFKLFLTKSSEREQILKDLGAIHSKSGTWDFSKAKTLLLYCNGAWCGQSPTAINALMDMGYPKEKMKYYRGGMQTWQLLGLTVIAPKDKKKDEK